LIFTIELGATELRFGFILKITERNRKCTLLIDFFLNLKLLGIMHFRLYS